MQPLQRRRLRGLIALEFLDRLDRIEDFCRCRRGLLGHRADLVAVGFVGGGRGEAIELCVRRPDRAVEVGGEFRLPHRTCHQRIELELVVAQRQQRVGAERQQD